MKAFTILASEFQDLLNKWFLCLDGEMHPLWRNDKILESCKKNNIHVTVKFQAFISKFLKIDWSIKDMKIKLNHKQSYGHVSKVN